MTKQERDTLRPGDMVRWDYATRHMPDSADKYAYIIYTASPPDVESWHTFTILFDLGEGRYGTSYGTGIKFVVLYEELLDTAYSLVGDV